MFQPTVRVLALCAGFAIVACGCNSARMVRWDGTSGVVAIPTNDDTWPTHNRQNAEALMKQQCPHGYQIVLEEEAVVGQVQHTKTDVKRTGDPVLAALHVAPVTTQTNQTTTSDDKKEWRITFRSVDAAAVGAPTVVPPGLPSSSVPGAK